MLQKVVVVELPSPYKQAPCWRCKEPLSQLAAVCPSCQAVQEFPTENIDYFSILGLKPSLRLTENEIRERFYALSRQTHPDRFQNVPEPEPSYALKWSTAVNKAYQTLKDENARTEYLVTLYGVRTDTHSKVPVDLAEAYFELQDVLTEEGAETKITEFRDKLNEELEMLDLEWSSIADSWDLTEDKKELLERLIAYLNKEKYINSMLLDIGKKLGGQSAYSWN